MYNGAVERLFNVGHAHDPVVETQSMIIAFSFVGIAMAVFLAVVGIKYLINYIRRDKKK